MKSSIRISLPTTAPSGYIAVTAALSANFGDDAFDREVRANGAAVPATPDRTPGPRCFMRRLPAVPLCAGSVIWNDAMVMEV